MKKRKATKRILSIVMAFAFVIAGLCIPEAKPALAAAKKISSAKDLLAMENNPNGDYYLAKDITVPKNTCLFADGTPFTGTLDGKGHKLKGYKSTEASAIFDSAKFAQFKNLSVTNVDIKKEGSAAALVNNSDGCEFKNVSVTGTIVSIGDEGSVGGIAASGSGSMEKCKNSAKITAKTKRYGKSVGGLAGDFRATSLKNCSNLGAVILTTSKDKYTFDSYSNAQQYYVAGLCAGEADLVASCKNSGSVSLRLNYSVDNKVFEDEPLCVYSSEIYVGGVCRAAKVIKSSGNTGKISVTASKSARVIGSATYVGGVAGGKADNSDTAGRTASKCYNTGTVSFTGACSGKTDGLCCRVGGVFGYCKGLDQCYNTGKVLVSGLSGNTGEFAVGGLSGETPGSITNCYNTGSVKVTNKGSKSKALFLVGGLTGDADVTYGEKVVTGTCNYGTGKVTAPSDYRNKQYQGQLIGRWAGPFLTNKSMYYNNYYTGSKAYGGGDTSWKPYMPTAKKVSSITSASCPKLSSKYWIYSSKHKRLILKNNKEK